MVKGSPESEAAAGRLAPSYGSSPGSAGGMSTDMLLANGGAGGDGGAGVYGGQGEVRVHAVTEPPVPPGLVAVLIDPTGRVVASATDFDQAGYGGFTLYRSQEIRVHRKLALAFVSAYGGPILADAFDTEDAMSAVERLISRKGYRRHIVPVGHTDKENKDG